MIPISSKNNVMKNPLVQKVERELNRLGMNNVKLIYESYDPKTFGNAEAVYEHGNLRLRFLRDRSDDMIQISRTNDNEKFYNLEEVAVLLGWISLDDLKKYDTPINLDEPPGPIFSLPEALQLIMKDLKKLNTAFSYDNIESTRTQLQRIKSEK